MTRAMHMSGDSDPSIWHAMAANAPWLVSIGVFIGGIWASLTGWMWRRQTQRIDDHGHRIGRLEREKADRRQVERLESWLRDDVQALHGKLDDIKRQTKDK